MVHGPLFFPLLVCGSFFDFYESLPLRDSFSFRPRYVKTTTLSDSRSPLPVHPLGRSCHLQFGSFLEKFSLQLYGVIKDEFLSWDPFYKLKRFRITVVFVVCYHRFRSQTLCLIVSGFDDHQDIDSKIGELGVRGSRRSINKNKQNSQGRTKLPDSKFTTSVLLYWEVI